MNTTLVNIPVNGFDKKVNKIEGIYPNLGLLYIASVLEHAGQDVNLIDVDAESLNKKKDFIKELKKGNPDVVGLQALSHMFPVVLQTAKIVKQTLPETKVVVGGPHVGIYSSEILTHPEIDVCVIREGEATVPELIKTLENEKSLKSVKGIAFKNNGKIFHTPERKFIQNLDEIPFPARHLIDNKKYFSILCKELPFTTMITSRGCPFACSYCYKTHWGRKYRFRSAKNVVDEMEECINNSGIKEIFFYDDTFSVNFQRVLDICDEIKKRKLDIAWDIRTRIDCVNKEMLRRMKEAGCIRIHYGIESGDQYILTNILKKSITIKQVRDVIKWTKENEIDIFTYWMLGAPTETRETIQKTIDFAVELDSDYSQFSIVTPEPETEIYEMAKKMRIFKGDFWRDVTLSGVLPEIPVYASDVLSKKDIYELSRKAYTSFYLRPNYMLKKLSRIRSLFEIKVLFNGFKDLVTYILSNRRDLITTHPQTQS